MSSIKEYVSEAELTFELYKLKFSKALREIKELSTEEITELFEKKRQRRISSIGKEFIKFSKDPQVLGYLQYNLNYINSLKPLTTTEQVMDLWQEQVAMFKEHLNKEQLSYPDDGFILSEKVSKENFGRMIMLIVSNLGTKPCFGTYTRNWKDDFYSNAIENVLDLSHNFDNKLLSKRTGKPMKAFAYITQISYNAFVAVIKARKKEQLQQKTILPYEVALIDGNISVKDLNLFQDENDYYFEEFSLEYDDPIHHLHIEEDTDDFLDISEEENSDIDEIDEDFLNEDEVTGSISNISSNEHLEIKSDDKEYIKKCLASIETSNQNIKYNIWAKSEIARFQEETPESDKTEDFKEYINTEFKLKSTPFKETRSVEIITKEVVPFEDKYSFTIRVKRS